MAQFWDYTFTCEERARGGDGLRKRTYTLFPSARLQPIETAIADTHNMRHYGEEKYALSDRAIYVDYRARGVIALHSGWTSDAIVLEYDQYAYDGETPRWHAPDFTLPRGLDSLETAYALLQKIKRAIGKSYDAGHGGWSNPDALEAVLRKLRFQRVYSVQRGDYGTETVQLRDGLTDLIPREPEASDDVQAAH